MKKVSIILITYNRAYVLSEAISSVLQQDYPVLELIIIDDGSNDNTTEIIKSYSDDRLQYHYLNHCGNLSILRNEGMKYANGDFIAFIDSDDIWETGKLTKQIEKLNYYPNAKFCFCDVKEWVNGDLKKSSVYSDYPSTIKKKFFEELVTGKMFIYPSSFLFEKDCLNETGYLNNELPLSDNEFMYRIAYSNEGVLLKESLVNIRKQADSFVKNREEEVWYEMIYALNKFYGEKKISYTLFQKEVHKSRYNLAVVLSKKKKLFSAAKNLLACISINPLFWKAYLRLLALPIQILK
jgi:glycosyltransferase involved in cell wall biosynthesis